MPRESERERDRPRAGERSHDHERRRRKRKSKHATSSSQSGSQLLSADALAQLDHLNQNRPVRTEEITPKKTRRKRPREYDDEREVVVEKSRREHTRKTYDDGREIVVEKSKRDHKRKSRRAVSGVLLEEGDGRTLRGIRGGDRDRYDRYEKESYKEPPNKKRKCRSFPNSQQ
jgi:glucan 1,3-beta-glucosidase